MAEETKETFVSEHAFDFIGKNGKKVEVWTNKQTKGRRAEGDSGEFYDFKRNENGGYGLSYEDWGAIIDPQIIVDEAIEPRIKKIAKKATDWINAKVSETLKASQPEPTLEQIAKWFNEKLSKLTIAEEGKRALKTLIQSLNAELTKYMDFSKPENKEKFLNTAMAVSQAQLKLDALENEDEPVELEKAA